MKPWNSAKPSGNHPSVIPRIKERHNLFLYVTLVVIAVLFIIASPAQAAAVPACPPYSDLPAMDENTSEASISPAGVPVAMIMGGPDRDPCRGIR